MIWTQNYFPSGGMALSALMAALPIIFFSRRWRCSGSRAMSPAT